MHRWHTTLIAGYPFLPVISLKTRFADLLDALQRRMLRTHVLARQFGVADDGAEDVVEVMRSAPCKGAVGIHILARSNCASISVRPASARLRSVMSRHRFETPIMAPLASLIGV